jgi:hypothetical protein
MVTRFIVRMTLQLRDEAKGDCKITRIMGEMGRNREANKSHKAVKSAEIEIFERDLANKQ